MDAVELVVECVERVGAERAVDRIDDHLFAAERMIERKLDISEQDKVATLTTSSESLGDLPEDFIAPILVTASGAELDLLTPVQIGEGQMGYTVTANQLHSYYAETEHTIRYRAGLVSLVSADSNYLLARHPDLYKYALMFQLATASGEVDEAPVYLGYFEKVCREIYASDVDATHSTASVDLGGLGL